MIRQRRTVSTTDRPAVVQQPRLLQLFIIPLLVFISFSQTTTTTATNKFHVASAFTSITTSPIHVDTVRHTRHTKPTLSTAFHSRTASFTTATATIRRKLSFFDSHNWDDIIYQTESLGNALASFSLQQQTSTPPTPEGMMMMNSVHDTAATTTTANNNMILAFPIMYLAGLLTSFSPCVWGLLPLTISYISTAANERSDQRTLLPTLAFATGLASVFCTMGMITVFTVGTVFGASSASTATTDLNGSNAMAYTTTMILPLVSNLVCFIMGLKLLDLVDIALPSLTFLDPQKLFATAPSSSSNTATMNMPNGGTSSGGPILLDASGRQVLKTTKTTATTSMETTSSTDQEQRQKETNKDNNALFRTFLLGGSSALVASPCATPVLTSILAYVANTMAVTESSSSFLSTIISTLIGGLLLFGYTLGYSTPLLIVAATSGQALVRLKQQNQAGEEPTQPISSFLYSIPNRIAPWVTPITGGILLYLGTTGFLVNLIGDPSLSGLTIIE
jgi:cytochrome c biogenesis protein CcdA